MSDAPWIVAPQVELDLRRRLVDQVEAFPPELIERGRQLLQSIWSELPKKALKLAPLIHLRTGFLFRREAAAYAKAVGVDPREIIVANIIYDLALSQMGCSSAAIATPDGPVLARNMDWLPEGPLARATATIRLTLKNGAKITHAGFPGSIGVVTGMSSRGFAIALNAVPAPGGTDRLGYPVLLLIRKVLEGASTFAAAVQRLSKTRLTSGAVFTVVGRQNSERVVIERGPRVFALRRPEGDEPLVATNHFRVLFPDMLPAANNDLQIAGANAGRYHCLLQSLPDDSQRHSDEALLYRLSDPGVIQDYTAQHVIARPYADEFRTWVPQRLQSASSES
ncbi:C45 family autoproteolytic acyltransferase/hydolase [Stratiformator vulcanicus]|uniref:Acyl-coenzyme A:6-aminopenicillanic acid acyl-transferase n=1 Tax=Stratiformator vulcanicus TaxID=2527980 RepID=A0A517QYS2_9PLAN|nr:C45 family peptidase [Stratiformator vulcanicus]QDT36748.1 Acyl-coenzyme A:6-aminopenicillanic acid acyl-transferase [Stratiformator vulcanicus]